MRLRLSAVALEDSAEGVVEFVHTRDAVHTAEQQRVNVTIPQQIRVLEDHVQKRSLDESVWMSGWREKED